MPLFDYLCRKCGHQYEEITAKGEDSSLFTCPKCGEAGPERQIVRFRVGGRGDLRESSELHGCHSSEAESHSHDQSHHHGSESGDGEK
ncbi:MAG: zinc ribbon domain-containing protein [Cryobacterium sp.]|nr:zinc ribbon domain-containing protein [Oligoflexia bacterium]